MFLLLSSFQHERHLLKEEEERNQCTLAHTDRRKREKENCFGGAFPPSVAHMEEARLSTSLCP
jgi:hypothetical protein